MSDLFRIKTTHGYVARDNTGWLILVVKDQADIFGTEKEAITAAERFTCEGWTIERESAEAPGVT